MKKIADVKQCGNLVNVRVKRESRVPSWFECRRGDEIKTR